MRSSNKSRHGGKEATEENRTNRGRPCCNALGKCVLYSTGKESEDIRIGPAFLSVPILVSCRLASSPRSASLGRLRHRKHRELETPKRMTGFLDLLKAYPCNALFLALGASRGCFNLEVALAHRILKV